MYLAWLLLVRLILRRYAAPNDEGFPVVIETTARPVDTLGRHKSSNNSPALDNHDSMFYYSSST